MPTWSGILPAGPARRVAKAAEISFTDVPDIVSGSSPPRFEAYEKRLRHGLLHFPLGEPADTRKPRW
jgi:hypothetical protein